MLSAIVVVVVVVVIVVILFLIKLRFLPLHQPELSVAAPLSFLCGGSLRSGRLPVGGLGGDHRRPCVLGLTVRVVFCSVLVPEREGVSELVVVVVYL